MKKIFSIILFAGLVLGTIGCKGNGSSSASDSSATDSKGSDSHSTTALEDSLSQTMGDMAGTDLKAGFQQNPDMEQQIDKDEFLKGMMAVIEMDTTKKSQSYMYGLQQGMRIYQELSQLEMQGVNVNRKLYINELKKAVESKDTLDLAKMQQDMQTKQNNANDMRERALKAKSEKNLAAGKKYVEELLKKDKDFKPATSGVYYKIENAGNGASFTDASVIDAKLLLKDINGNVLQNMSEPQPLPLAQIKQDPIFGKLYDIIKGMKPGAKATIVIPGDQIPEDMGLAPNMTYIFEITTVGLHTDTQA